MFLAFHKKYSPILMNEAIYSIQEELEFLIVLTDIHLSIKFLRILLLQPVFLL